MATTYRITTREASYGRPVAILDTRDADAADLDAILDEMGVPRRASVRRERFYQCRGEVITWKEIETETTETIEACELNDGDVILYGSSDVRMVVTNVDTSGATTTYYRKAEAGYGRTTWVETGAHSPVRRERLAR